MGNVKNFLLYFVTLLWPAVLLAAEHDALPQLSPIPQQVTWGEGSVAVATKTITGVRGDNAVRPWAKKIPQQAEGYYLSVSTKAIVIAATDSAGLFYGQQTLRQLRRADGGVSL